MYTKYVTSMNNDTRLGFVAHSFSIPNGKLLLVTRDGALLVNRDEIVFNSAVRLPRHGRIVL